MENYLDLGQVSMNLPSVFNVISPDLWQELMGFMYVQVAQQHRDIMREILGTRKTKGSGMTTQDVFGKWKVFPQKI